MRNLAKGSVIQLERRGYYYVDEIAFGDKVMKLHFIPDGTMSGMSKIKSKLDAKEMAKGKGEGAAFANKAEMLKA